jgi:hypothetical protein
MERLTRVVGPAGTNVHILADGRSREAIAIDTAIPSLDWIAGELAARDWSLRLIVSTHVRGRVVPIHGAVRQLSPAGGRSRMDHAPGQDVRQTGSRRVRRTSSSHARSCPMVVA